MNKDSTTVYSPSFPPCVYKEYLITGDTKGIIYLHSESDPPTLLHVHTSQILYLLCIEDILISSSSDCTIIIWDLILNLEKYRIYFNSPIIYFTLTNKILTVLSKDNWANYEFSLLTQRLSYPKSRIIHRMLVNSAGNFLLGVLDKYQVYVWNIISFALVEVIDMPCGYLVDYGDLGLIMRRETEIYAIGKESKTLINIEDPSICIYQAKLAPDQSFIVYLTADIHKFKEYCTLCTLYVYSFQHSQYLSLKITFQKYYCSAISSDSKYIAVCNGFLLILFAPDQENPIFERTIKAEARQVGFENNTNNIFARTLKKLLVLNICGEILFCIHIFTHHLLRWSQFSKEKVCLLTMDSKLVTFDIESQNNISKNIMLKSVFGATTMDKDGETMISDANSCVFLNREWKKQGNSKRFYLLLIFHRRLYLR